MRKSVLAAASRHRRNFAASGIPMSATSSYMEQTIDCRDPEQLIAVVDLFAHHAIFEPFGV
jgi:hypothetical protein